MAIKIIKTCCWGGCRGGKPSRNRYEHHSRGWRQLWRLYDQLDRWPYRSFCAAVTQRSISNWISFYGTSDIGPAFVKFQLLRELDETEGLWKMSPLAYASQVKTPTLVLHGENDLRCPQEQGQQFYMALQRQGVDTKLMLFPQSSHGLSRNGLPNLRIERLQAISEWLASHENKSVN